MLIFRGGTVARDDVSPSVLQAHLEKWYAWADELARQGRGNVGTPLADGGSAVRGRERLVTDGPYAESKDLVTGAMIIDAASMDDAVEVARGCPTYECAGDGTILARHLLPNMASTLLVQATVWIPQAIIGEAVLSFLGLGVQPPTPSWGSMLSDAQPFILLDAWLAVFPGVAIFLATMSFNLLGDGLRDMLDPRTRR
jgi:hypothetical protein